MTRPPGPWQDASHAAANRSDTLTVLVEGMRRYGDLWELAPDVYVVADVAMTRKILRDGSAFGTGPGTFAIPRRARQALDDVRAARNHALSHRAVGRRTGMTAVEAATMAADWPSGTSQVLPRVKEAVTRIGTRHYYGEDADLLLHAEDEVADLRLSVGGRYIHLPNWIPTPARLHVRHAQHTLARRIQHVIDQRVAHERHGDDLLAALIDACHAEGHPPHGNISHELVSLMVAAQEMPLRAAGWLMLALARHPDWADRIADEADDVLPQEPGQTDVDHVAGLVLTDAFVRETLRLHPPNYLIPRDVLLPVTIGDHRLAPPTRVLVSPYLLHHDARHFHSAETFTPQRWLVPTRPTPNGAYLPYGAGVHRCPGAALAALELTLLTAYMARSHHLTLPGPSCFELTTAGSLTPAHLRLESRPRKQRAGR